MKIEFYRDESAFEGLGGEWNELVARGASNVPFLRREYQRAWWANRGGGEWPIEHGRAATLAADRASHEVPLDWPDGQSGQATALRREAADRITLLIAAGRDESGRLTGLAPLFFVEKNRDGLPALMSVGSSEISDYLDLIVAPEDVEAFVSALLDALGSDSSLPPWQVIDLYNIPEASLTHTALERAAAARGWQVTKQPLQPCPAIPISGDWESYLANIDKKQRHEIRRKLRRAETGDPPIAWHIVGREEDIEVEIERFMAMMALGPAKAGFLTEAMRSQFRDSMRAAHANGWLQLAWLTVEGKPAAGYLNFDYDNKLWIYNSALDPAYGKLSVGWVLLAYLIQWAIENGRRELDFMRGDEEYKLKFGGVAKEIYRVTVRR